MVIDTNVSDATSDLKDSKNTENNSYNQDDMEEHNAAAEQLEELSRSRDPLKYCILITSFPKTAFALTLIGHILLVTVTAILIGSGYDLIPITFDRIPLEIRNQDDYLNHLSWFKRNEKGLVLVRGIQSNGKQITRSKIGDILNLYFEGKNGENVFTKDNLETIKNIEQIYWNNTEYRSSYCQVATDNSKQCRKPTSILRLFDGSILPFKDEQFNNITYTLNYAWKHNPQKLLYFLGKNYVINESRSYTGICRSRIFFGIPLPGYVNVTDRHDDQLDEIQKYMKLNIQEKSNNIFENDAGEMNFFYSSLTLILDTIIVLVFADMTLTMGSLIFIVIFLMIQTGSLWVSLWAVFSIITSFFGANLVYRIVLDMRYFGVFHVLAIFILLCIGADDVFVFYDTWKMSAHFKYESLAHRLSDTYRKAAGAMMFTSLTTAVAFAVSATSPLLGVSSFGIFSALLIVVNYISVVVFFPTVVVSYHLFWEKYRCCCCCTVKNTSVVDAELSISKDTSMEKNDKHLYGTQLDGKRHNLIVRFFEGPYYHLITHKVAKWFILIMYAVFISFAIYEVTTLKINEEQVKFLKDSTNYGQYFSKSTTAFSPSNGDATTYVLFVMGLKGQNLTSCHHTDHLCIGHTSFDDDFSLNTEESQIALLKLCKKIKNLSIKEKRELYININKATGKTDMLCFIEDMEIFYIAMSFWLYNGFNETTDTRLKDYDQYLGEQIVVGETIRVLRTLPGNNATWYYEYGTRLRYAAISFSTDLESATLGYIKGLPIRDKWQSLIERERALLPSELQGIVQTSYDNKMKNLWHWLALQKILVRSAILGVGIGLSVACPILIFATGNIITGLLATFSIILTTLSVIAIIPLGGWKLGLIESLNLTLVVGLSVDYVVHLAEGYSRSAHRKRKGRLQDSLRQVGISIISGAVTTMGGSAFMLFAQITLFAQFGLFMFCTIFFSVIFSLGLFTTVLGIIGPEDDSGKVKTLWKKIKCF